MAERRVGILGGTFNPIHIGHLRAAIEVTEALGLDAVEFVPAARPPHKAGNGLLDFALRLELCRRAIEDLPDFSVNPLEAERPGPSYTCDTLAELARTRPDQRFTFIMGMADLLCLGQWKNGFALGRWASLAVHARAGLALETFTDCLTTHAKAMEACPTDDPACWRVAGGHTIRFVSVPRLDICSSDIRARWQQGRCVDHFVPQSVMAMLRVHEQDLRQCWGQAPLA